MIRVSVIYPNEPGKKFDWDYYLNNHKTLVREKLGGIGLVKAETDRGVGTVQPGAPAPFIAVGHMYFECMEDLQKCLPSAGELMSDVPNFTDIQPQVQISEIV